MASECEEEAGRGLLGPLGPMGRALPTLPPLFQFRAPRSESDGESEGEVSPPGLPAGRGEGGGGGGDGGGGGYRGGGLGTGRNGPPAPGQSATSEPGLRVWVRCEERILDKIQAGTILILGCGVLVSF